MSERIEQIVQHLLGTCMTMSEACDSFNIDEDNLTMKELEYLDEQIFCCEGCSWWYDIGEQKLNKDDESVCGNCIDDEKQEGEEE